MIAGVVPRQPGPIEILETLWHFADDLNGFHTDRAYTQQQFDPLFLVIGKAIGVELPGYCGVFGLLLLVALHDPLQGRIRTQPVFLNSGNSTSLGF